MSADPNPVDRLEQAATQFKNRGVIQLAVQGLLLEVFLFNRKLRF